jgi:hypothetical protein
MRPVRAALEKDINSEFQGGICISRVDIILAINEGQGNVTYCRGFSVSYCYRILPWLCSGQGKKAMADERLLSAAS